MLWQPSKLTAMGVMSYLLLALQPVQANTTPQRVVVSIGRDALPYVQAFMPQGSQPTLTGGDVALLEVSEEQLPLLSAVMHEKFNRCGGFMVEANGLAAAEQSLRQAPPRFMAANPSLYSINEQERVSALLPQLTEEKVRATISHLASYRNRYYKSQHGVSSQRWVLEQWRALANGRSDIKVELVTHAGYEQPSVVLTWQGSQKPDEVVVVGGHGDSIAGWYPAPDVSAPGADDNASGIATITEVIRVLMASDFAPERTLKFMSYAAEEVGLKGSQDIAASYRAASLNVVGVMQLDMTNFSGSSYDIVLMDDHTDAGQNTFLKNLAQTYQPETKVANDRCGYACSDHASWTRQGYPASFPFESTMDNHNQDIHTARDTLARSHNHARHAMPFAKLALSFVVELTSL